MKTTRIHNVSVFVTVLSACLLAVGTSAQICAQPTHTVDQSSASIERNLSGKKIRFETKRLIYQTAMIRPRIEYPSNRTTSVQILTENTKPFVGKNTILVVSHLPRAGLDAPLAEQPAAD